jgi:Na+-transporting methylmalonyl-CoA/oxaloacetate decarboxylase gamma subunit
MNQSVTELLRQGLILTVLGMGLLFAALALLWGLIALLIRLFRPESEKTETVEEPTQGPAAAATAMAPPPTPADALTAERARVAAIVAAALLANAIPLLAAAPAAPTFVAPGWVSTNRPAALQPWQPPRFSERARPSHDF